MSDLLDLYKEVVIDHGRRPRNFRVIETASHQADGYNPLCGDRLTLYVQVDDDGVIQDVAFKGSGCAISTASASLLTEHLRGKTVDQAAKIFDHFHRVLTEDGVDSDSALLGKLAALEGVRQYPTRVKCATLAWHTLQSALNDEGNVTTE